MDLFSAFQLLPGLAFLLALAVFKLLDECLVFAGAVILVDMFWSYKVEAACSCSCSGSSKYSCSCSAPAPAPANAHAHDSAPAPAPAPAPEPDPAPAPAPVQVTSKVFNMAWEMVKKNITRENEGEVDEED